MFDDRRCVDEAGTPKHRVLLLQTLKVWCMGQRRHRPQSRVDRNTTLEGEGAHILPKPD